MAINAEHTSRPGDMVGGERKNSRMDIPAQAGAWISKAEASEPTHTDTELAALTRSARRGSQAAFSSIFERFQTPIVNYIYRLVGDWEVANDLAQDTFLKAYNALPRTAEDLQISPWLYRIATNTALDALRRRKRITWVPFKLDLDPVAPGSDPSIQQAESDAIGAALKQVPEDQRICLVLNMLQGLSYKEIAEVLGISTNLVAVRIYRGREKFIDAYNRANPTD